MGESQIENTAAAAQFFSPSSFSIRPVQLSDTFFRAFYFVPFFFLGCPHLLKKYKFMHTHTPPPTSMAPQGNKTDETSSQRKRWLHIKRTFHSNKKAFPPSRPFYNAATKVWENERSLFSSCGAAVN